MTSRLISVEERRARIGTRHRLAASSRASSPEEVVAALVALHATDAATVFLSLARLASPSVATVEQALYEDRTLARMHGMRQTLFVFPAELAAAIQASTTRELWVKERASLLKSAADAGLANTWLDDLEARTLAALGERGLATGSELSKAVPGLRDQILYGKGTASEGWQTATARVLRVLGFDGRIMRDRPVGTWTSSRFRWALAAAHDDVPVAEARAELVRRWLAAFGPGTEADLKWWTGWKVTDVRKALAGAGAVEVRVDSGPAWVVAEDEEAAEDAAAEPWAALLPGLDPTPMGWQARDWYLADEHRAALFDRSGNVGPTVWWNGEVVGGWAQRADGSVATRLSGDVGQEGAAAVAAEAERWRGLLGDIRVTPRFRTPLERELAR